MRVGTNLRMVLAGLAVGACDVEPAAPPSDPLEPADRANEVLPWAFVLNDPAPDDAEPADPDEIVSVPGSELELRRGDINLDNGPPDWHPDGHPPMPEVVARGGDESDVLACAYCHLPNGQGKPENAGLAGQPYEYLVQQMKDYRNGLRRTGEPRMGPPSLMMSIGAAATDEEARVAAEYFSSIDFKPWIRVVETDSVPVTRFAGWIHEVVEGEGREPIGNRVVEIPESLERTKLRDDASGFIAYVPEGAVARGETLVRTGGADGRTVACTVCHGEDLRGLGPVPALAGRSPSYMVRQLYDLKAGNRAGTWSDLMDAAVADLTVRDVVDIVAYTASLEP
ncbi:MAG: cytochrome C-binding protein [Gemmatimonadota bacterium]|nr:cytochrome C-binding protein [Gemmatimonadota bacterium]